MHRTHVKQRRARPALSLPVLHPVCIHALQRVECACGPEVAAGAITVVGDQLQELHRRLALAALLLSRALRADLPGDLGLA